MLEMEISLIGSLQDMKAISGNQKAYTGIHEVRYTDKDTLNYQMAAMQNMFNIKFGIMKSNRSWFIILQ